MTASSGNKNLIRSAAVMSGITLISRFLGLVREIVRAHFLGTSLAADAFAIAFMIPNLFRRFVGEGAMVAAAVPVIVDEKEHSGIARVTEVSNSLLTIFTFILTAFCVVFVIFSPFLVEEVFARGYASDSDKMALTIELTRYMFFYLLFIGVSAIFQAILNSFRIFGPSSFTPVLLNLCIVGCAIFLSDFFGHPVYAFSAGVLIGGMLQLFFQVPYLMKIGIKLRPSFNWSDPAVKKVFRLMAPGMLGAGVYQINILISQMIATYLSDGSVAALQYSSRLTEFTLGVFVVAISTAVLPSLSTYVSQGRMDDYRQTLEFSLRVIAFITIPAMAGLILIRYPLIYALFRTGEFDAESVNMTAYAFLYHTLGIYFIGASRVLVPAFHSLKDMMSPVKAAAVATVVNIVACLLLMGPLEQGGIALANSLSVLVQLIVLGFIFRSKVGDLQWRNLTIAWLRIGFISIAMFLCGRLLLSNLDFDMQSGRLVVIANLLLVIGACALVYALLAKLSRCPEMNELLHILKRRRSN